MRTSQIQYVIMVEFMERNGDLSKPSGGPRGRHYIKRKWNELVQKLNSDGTGDSRSEEKWRKVWSDLKNNTKKKWAKINRAASGTGGGPALQLSLNDLENRVMQIIGVQAATGMVVAEAGFKHEEAIPSTQTEEKDLEAPMYPLLEEATEDWNMPGTSSQPNVAPPVDMGASMDAPLSPPVVINLEEPWEPPAPKKTKIDSITKLFIDSDNKAREYARERDMVYERLETERLRLRELEIRETARQRRLQTQWLVFIKEAMNVLIRYLDRENR